MSSHSTRSGSRRHRGGRPRSNSNRSQGSGGQQSRRAPQKPAGFWDKIKQFFGITPKSAPATTSRSSRHEGGRSERPSSSRDENRGQSRREPRAPRTPREPRKPEAIEVTTPRLYIGNLSYDTVESDLFELFSGVGSVVNTEIITNKHTQRSKGFGFVQMTNVSEAKRAVEELHDKEYMGRKLVVSGAKLPPDRPIGRPRDEEQQNGEDAVFSPSPEAEDSTSYETAQDTPVPVSDNKTSA